MLTFLAFLILGYILGSVSPGYFFGWVVKHVDIRNFGNGNTGASNTHHIVGPVYGIITALFDLLKSALAYYWSLSWVNTDLAILIGLAAVLGHIFPFYLRFRGGKGAASLDGLFLISLFFSNPVYSLLLLIGMMIYYCKFMKSIKLSFRHTLKLFALIFPLGLIWLPAKFIVEILGAMFVIVVAFDLIRLCSPVLNEKYLKWHMFSKQKEGNRFSGYTLFLFSALVVIWLFPKEIAVVSLMFFILGDIFAPLSKEVQYLPQKSLIGDKTIAGFMVVLAISFFAGIFLWLLTPLALSLKIVIWGALFTSVFDQLSFILDDNLLVPISTAVVLSLLVV